MDCRDSGIFYLQFSDVADTIVGACERVESYVPKHFNVQYSNYGGMFCYICRKNGSRQAAFIVLCIML